MTNARVATLILISTLAVPVLAFQQAELLTNPSVVKMVAERVPTATIFTRIQTTPNSFDVSASALVELFQSRVPADLISVMLKAQSRTPTLDNAGVVAMVVAKLPAKLITEKIAMSPTAFDMSQRERRSLLDNKVAPEILAAMNDAAPKGGPPTQHATVASVTAPTNPPNTAGAPMAVTTTEPKATPLPRVRVPAPTPIYPTPVAAISIAQAGDGEAAVFTTGLTVADAIDKVESYFKSRAIGFTVGLDNRLVTGWFNERSCGPNLLRCANRATVSVGSDAGRTTIRVQMFERSRLAVPNPKPWTENASSKGKETSETAVAIQTYVK